MPEFKDGEVYQNTNIEKGDYTNTRYVKGTSLNQTVDQAGKKLWNTVDDFTKWLQKNMPGKDITSKYRNFIELLDLEKSGIRRSDGKFDSMSDRGNFWISRADGVGSWRLDFGGVHVVVDWNDLDGARPVVCFED
ncbi:MAG: hypothetical protein H6766_06640 [Candidatus Peribacteria bacterium]|nr:MAG: hypothetical protein H6766_06640 [Candidatus Peribacteria bacterium]